MTQVFSTRIDRIKSHSQCRLRGFLEENYKSLPIRAEIRNRISKGVTSLIIMGLGHTRIPDSCIADITARTFSGLDTYDGLDSDIQAASEVYNNLANILYNNELTIVDVRREFEISYGGVIVKSYFDGIVEDGKLRKKIPFIVDITRARYDVMYSSSIYHAQTVVDLYGYLGPSTRVLVLSIGSGKKWMYDHDSYSGMVKEAIECFADEIANDRICAVVGMHCTWCSFRGICHLQKRSRR